MKDIVAPVCCPPPFCRLSLICAATLSADEPGERQALRTRAEGGDVAAQAALAIRYRDSEGLAKEDAEALERGIHAAGTWNAREVTNFHPLPANEPSGSGGSQSRSKRKPA